MFCLFHLGGYLRFWQKFEEIVGLCILDDSLE